MRILKMLVADTTPGLEDLARQAGAAAASVALTTALQTSRQRIVSAREEERRRLRRELHDGVASALTAIGLKVDSAAALASTDAHRAQASCAVCWTTSAPH